MLIEEKKIIKKLFSASTNLGLTARNAGKLFVAGEDDTGQGQGHHCATRQGKGYRSAARNKDIR
jgi:hypothetical protein